MKTRILGILAGIALLLSAGSVYAGGFPGGPKPVKVFGTEACSFVNSAITFDGVNYASIDPCTGHNTFGIYNDQTVGAYLTLYPSGLPITGSPCKAPDGTAGESFPLEFAEFVATYNFNNDQLFAYSFTGNFCVSATTASYGGSTEYTIIGGTGIFTGATGTDTVNFSGSFLYYMNTGFPPGTGQTGYFGQDTATETGTITP
jgi:hypothetical protein